MLYALFLFFALGGLLGLLAGWRSGWNAAVRLYERRAVERAHEVAQGDLK